MKKISDTILDYVFKEKWRKEPHKQGGNAAFATEDIKPHENLGLLYFKENNEIVRTELSFLIVGGFDSNCYIKQSDDKFFLFSKRKISIHEEFVINAKDVPWQI